MTITSSVANNVSVLPQVNDGVQAPSYKPFTIDNNKLDGTFHPIETGQQVGYLGKQLSNADGMLPTTEHISYAFNSEQATMVEDAQIALQMTAQSAITNPSWTSYNKNLFQPAVGSVIGGSASATNVFANGNFSNGTSGWSSANGSIATSNNIATITGNGSAAKVDLTYNSTFNILANNKKFVSAQVMVKDSLCTSIQVFFFNGIYTNELTIITPIANQWYTVSGICTTSTAMALSVFNVVTRYVDATTANGKVLQVQNVNAIDMGVDTTNPLYNLTSDTMNTLVQQAGGYWDGAKNIGGVTCTVDDQQRATLTGTAITNMGIRLFPLLKVEDWTVQPAQYNLISGKPYTLSKTDVNGTMPSAVTIALDDTANNAFGNNTLTYKRSSITATSTGQSIAKLALYVTSGVVFNNYTFKLQLEQSSTPTSWVQALSSTLNITASLAAGDTLTWDGTTAKVNNVEVAYTGSLSTYAGGTLVAVGGTDTGFTSVQQLVLCGDTLSNIYPVDFTVTYHTSDGSTTIAVTNNASVIWTKKLDARVDINSIEFDITKINAAGKTNRIIDMEAARGIINSIDALLLAAVHDKAITNTFTRIDTLLPTILPLNAIDNGNFALSSNNLAAGFTLSNATAVSCTGNTQTFIVKSQYGGLLRTALTLNHKYFISASVKTTSQKVHISANGQPTSFCSGDNAYHCLCEVITVTNSGSMNVGVIDNSVSDWQNISVQDFQAIDCGTAANPTEDYDLPADQLAAKYANYVGQSELTNQCTRIDTILPRTADSKAITNSFTCTDVLKPTVAASKNITVDLFRTDSLLVKKSIEVQEQYLFNKVENFMLYLVEMSEVINVYTRMREAARQTFAKMDVVYSDPKVDPALTISSNSVNPITDIGQLADGISVEAYKWFDLAGNNKLDGTCHPIDIQTCSVGWWSNCLSKADGTFDVAPTVILQFTPRGIASYQISGDDQINNYPVDFTIAFYAGDTIKDTETVTGNTKVTIAAAIPAIQDITRIVLTITKISVSNSVAKLTELFPVLNRQYTGASLCDLHILEEKYPDTGALQLGNISANELTASLDNSNHDFDKWNSNTALPRYLLHNRKITAYLGVKIGSEIEWYQQGVFWTTNWNVPDDTLAVTVTAYDRLNLLAQSDFYNTQVYENYTLYQLAELILLDAGLTTDEFHIDDYLKSIVIPIAWFAKQSHREALQQIASCAPLDIYCDKFGNIEITPTDLTSVETLSFSDATNVYSKSYPLRWAQVANYIEVAATPQQWDSSQEILNVSQAFALAAHQTITIDYTYSNPPCKQVSITVTADAALQYSIATYGWGATITFTNNSEAVATVTSISGTGIPLIANSSITCVAKDDDLIATNGKIKASISHFFLQDQAYAYQLAQKMLQLYKNSTQDVELDSRGDIALRLGDQIDVQDRHGTSELYRVYRQTIDWAGTLDANILANKY